MGFVFLNALLLQITGTYKSLFYTLVFLYWLLTCLVGMRLKPNSRNFIGYYMLALCCLFLPQYLMRDTLLAICWGLGSVLLLFLSGTRSNIARAIIISGSLVLIVYGLWTRSNGIIGMIPLIAFLLVRLTNEYSIRAQWSSLIAACLFSGFIYVEMIRFNDEVMRADKQHPAYKLMLFDIIGISKLQRHDYLPESVKDSAYNFDLVLQKMRPATMDDVYWHTPSLMKGPDSMRAEEVRTCWKKLIKRHPFSYLKNRLNGYLYYLRIRKSYPNSGYWNVSFIIDKDEQFRLEPNPNQIRTLLEKCYVALSKVGFFEPWLWLLTNLAACIVLLRRSLRWKSNYLFGHAMVQLSAFLYTLSQLPVYQFDRDFRYFYWNVVAVLFAITGLSEKREKENSF
jgi:hypothetical protein